MLLHKMKFPPGIVYLAHRLHHAVLPPILVYIGTRAWTVIFMKPIPGWAKASACILSIPLALACSILYKEFRNKREAAIRGAVLAPRTKSGIGGIDVLLTLTRSFKAGWIGMHHDALSNSYLYSYLPCMMNIHSGSPFDKYCETYGPTVNLRFLFEDRVGALISPLNIR